MNPALEQSLIQSAKHSVANKTTSVGATEHRADVQRYVGQERFEAERERVFGRLPTVLLHSSELADADSYQAVDTPYGSLIVSRDAQGKVHVFRNSCRHRGARLVQGKMCKKRIVCPYHAWSYTTDGALSTVPGQTQCFPALDKEQNGLLTIPCAEKFGFIWLCPAAPNQASAESHLVSHLGGMAEHLEWMAVPQLMFFKRTTRLWRGNWKLFAEGGLETYHFAFAHQQTIAPSFYNNIAIIDQIDKHFRVVMPTRELERGDPQSLHDCSHTLFSLTPNSALLVQKAHVDWIQFTPRSPGETEISVTSLIPQSTDLEDEKQTGHWQKNHHITNVTLNEDWALGESIQRSMQEGALPYIQYGKNEWALQALNETLDALLARD